MKTSELMQPHLTNKKLRFKGFIELVLGPLANGRARIRILISLSHLEIVQHIVPKSKNTLYVVHLKPNMILPINYIPIKKLRHTYMKKNTLITLVQLYYQEINIITIL